MAGESTRSIEITRSSLGRYIATNDQVLLKVWNLYSVRPERLPIKIIC